MVKDYKDDSVFELISFEFRELRAEGFYVIKVVAFWIISISRARFQSLLKILS